MKYSHYTIIVHDYPQEKQYLLFNTRSQALVKIEQELKDVIENYRAPEYFRQRFQYSQELAQLHQMGVIVTDEQEDKTRLEDFFRQIKFGLDTKVLSVNILTTYACNFKCVYCFEESSREDEQMDLLTCDMIMSWLKKRMQRFGYEKLYLIFYGGEPLLNTKAIEYMAGHMQKWCREQHKAFNFMLQTNGYLFSPDIAEHLLPLGLDNVRVSLDGPQEDHDRTRPLASGGGSFSRIVENILSNINRVKISVSVSYQQGKVDHIQRLLDYFEEQGILSKLGRFIFAPVYASLGAPGTPDKIRHRECLGNCQPEYMVPAVRKINQILQSKQLANTHGLGMSACPLTREYGGITIDQQGRVFKCNMMLGHPEYAVGDVCFEGFSRRHEEFRDLDVWRQCPEDCPYLPLCAGGCRLASFLAHQNFHTPVCHKAYLDAMAEDFIKQEYRELQAKQG